MCDRAEFGFDQNGAWFVRYERPWTDEEDGTSGIMRAVFVSNGRSMVATSPDDNEGRLTSAEPSQFTYITSPWMTLGRLHDLSCKRRLHELLSDAKDVDVTGPSGGRGVCSISGTVSLGGAAIRLRVTVDPSLNFAPIAIEHGIADRDQPIQRLVAMGHIQLDGHYLPTRIVRGVYNAWDPNLHQKRIDAIRKHEASVDPDAILRAFPVAALAGDKALTIAWRSLAAVGTCGIEPKFVVANLGMGEAGGPYTPDIAIVEWISVNQPLPDELSLKTLPAGKRIFDGFSGLTITTTGPAPTPAHVP